MYHRIAQLRSQRHAVKGKTLGWLESLQRTVSDPNRKILRGLAAGWGAKKLGGGCISTIIIFLILWWLLGNFDIFR